MTVKGRQSGLELCGVYSPCDVFSFVGSEDIVSYDGYTVKLTSSRLKTFKKNCSCVICGREGEVMLLEGHPNDGSPHFNMYAKDEYGNLILMTKDHILPKSMGGADHQENYQTMCCECNWLKANRSVSNEELRNEISGELR